MRRDILGVFLLSLAAVPAQAATFTPAPIAPDYGLTALTRGAAREQLGRDLFSSPWATVTLSNVDVYDRFPYIESRNFQIVSDPRWNRLVYGEVGQSLHAYDGGGTSAGSLASPRGLAVDEHNHVYVADAGNNRIVVLEAVTEFDDMRLKPLYTIGGLHEPFDVAYSDGGTPFHPGDDLLLVADTGRNRIVSYALSADGARETSSLGGLGSGVGCFAGPMAVTIGRSGGANTPDVFVADAHTQRLVRLRIGRTGLAWVSAVTTDAGAVTSLDTDQWGNVYAAAPGHGLVRKFTPDLVAVADLHDGLSMPRSFRVPFANVRDHRDGSVSRVGRPTALSVDEWSTASGMRLWNLGVEVASLRVSGVDAPVAHFVLTDRAAVSLEVRDGPGGRVLARRAVGALDAGAHDVSLLPADLLGAEAGRDLSLRLIATSSYPGGAAVNAQTSFRASGAGAALLPSSPLLLGNSPNPVHESTRISFLLPAAPGGRVALRLFDAQGRRIRTYEGGFSPGLNEVTWDGTDDHGRTVMAGVYFYRLDVGTQQISNSLVFLH